MSPRTAQHTGPRHRRPSRTTDPAPIRVLAGARARARIARDGLRAADIAAVVAAAGGPKGLALLPVDRFVFGHWLADAPRPRLLTGASIGAWRMAAGAQRDPLAALDRLQHAYLERQRYPLRPTPLQVSETCRTVVRDLLGACAAGFVQALDPQRTLRVVTARFLGRRGERLPLRLAFAGAALANTLSRARLGAHFQRVVFEAGPPAAARPTAAQAVPAETAAAPDPMPRDRFATRTVPLRAHNIEDALLASGSIPLLTDPVRNIDEAPAGDYWDGGLIDYHLYWNWNAVDGLVLYPHFSPQVTAGWLDKLLPWRRHGIGIGGSGWLDNVVLVVPSPSFMARLPAGKLPDRDDFYRYGLAHDRRLADWRRTIAECERLADALAAFVERPDPTRLEPLDHRARP